MDIKFPKEENPFPKTMAVAVFSVIVAFLIGMFLGNALGALFGTDDSIINTTTYTDYMTAAKSAGFLYGYGAGAAQYEWTAALWQ